MDAATLAAYICDARQRTLDLVADLTDEQLIGARLEIVNPLLWEIGHLAWFQEKWVLRHVGNEGPACEDGDVLYDSSAIPHDTRWDLLLPSRKETLTYLCEVRDRVLDMLAQRELSKKVIYFVLLAVFHEDMHTEAFTYTRQTLSYPPPRFRADGELLSSGQPKVLQGAGLRRSTSPPAPPEVPSLCNGTQLRPTLTGDVEIPGGIFLLGATTDEPFVFDNEKRAHPVEIKPFLIARTPVTQVEFAAFVDDDGYGQRALWSNEGWRWREAVGARHPVYWRRGNHGGWERRHFDQWFPLEPHRPVIHVNWYEAETYCRWARRRLPTEAEWELAAAGDPDPDGGTLSHRKRRFPWGDDPPDPQRANLDWRQMRCVEVAAHPTGESAFGCRQMIGNVWEWTASDFLPYPGFTPDPYKEYSQPWFGTHKVLRGGCWATRSRLLRNTWRNFYRPDRRDVWAGFRTCALTR